MGTMRGARTAYSTAAYKFTLLFFDRIRVARLYFPVCFSHVDSVVDLVLFMFFVMCFFIFIYDLMVITSWYI